MDDESRGVGRDSHRPPPLVAPSEENIQAFTQCLQKIVLCKIRAATEITRRGGGRVGKELLFSKGEEREEV